MPTGNTRQSIRTLEDRQGGRAKKYGAGRDGKRDRILRDADVERDGKVEGVGGGWGGGGGRSVEMEVGRTTGQLRSRPHPNTTDGNKTFRPRCVLWYATLLESRGVPTSWLEW